MIIIIETMENVGFIIILYNIFKCFQIHWCWSWMVAAAAAEPQASMVFSAWPQRPSRAGSERPVIVHETLNWKGPGPSGAEDWLGDGLSWTSRMRYVFILTIRPCQLLLVIGKLSDDVCIVHYSHFRERVRASSRVYGMQHWWVWPAWGTWQPSQQAGGEGKNRMQ